MRFRVERNPLIPNFWDVVDERNRIIEGAFISRSEAEDIAHAYEIGRKKVSDRWYPTREFLKRGVD